MNTNEEMISALEDDIAKHEAALAAKKLVLKEMLRAPSVPFIATPFGMALNKAIAAITKPFSDMYHNAEVASQDPQSYIICRALEEADKVVAECVNTPARNDAGYNEKNAKKMALKAANTRMVISKFNENELFALRVAGLEEALHDQVTRLRIQPVSQQVIADASKALAQLGAFSAT